MTKTPTPKAVLIIGLLFTLIWVSGCDRSDKNEKHEQQPPSQAKTEKPIGRDELPIGNSTYYVQKDKPVNTQILEIAIETDDQAVINAFLQRAISGDTNAKEAMRTANPERYISLAKRGKYSIDAEAFRFLIVMDGYGNQFAHAAIEEIKNRDAAEHSPGISQQRDNSAPSISRPLSSLSIPSSIFGANWFVKRFLAIDDWSDIPKLSPPDRIDAQNSRAKMEPQGVRGIAVYGVARAPDPDPKSFQIAVLRFKDLPSLKSYQEKECQYTGWNSDFKPVENVSYFAVDSVGGHIRYASVGVFFIEVKELLGDGEYRKAVDPIVKQLEGK